MSDTEDSKEQDNEVDVDEADIDVPDDPITTEDASEGEELIENPTTPNGRGIMSVHTLPSAVMKSIPMNRYVHYQLKIL